MYLRTTNQFYDSDKSYSFNMTPIIDIVFLLIIFFLVVFQFIEAENFSVDVPDDCQFAQVFSERPGQITTVTVMDSAEGEWQFAVGAEKITPSAHADISDEIAELIDSHLKDIPLEQRIVTLRIDKNVRFAQAQYALAGIAKSIAKDIKLATLKDKRNGPKRP